MMLGGSSALTAGVQAFFSRRTVKIDATAALSDVSIRQVDAMERDLAAAKDQMRKFQEALYRHQRWDSEVLKRLNQLGVTDIEDPPSLWI